VPIDEIWHTRAVLDALVPGHRAAWGKFSSSEETADLLEGAVLQREARQVGDDVVQGDQFGGTVRPFQS
jgi:hypothetical protein